MNLKLSLILCIIIFVNEAVWSKNNEHANEESVQISMFGLGAMKITNGETIIFIDAFADTKEIESFDYSGVDIILVTHDHGDHFCAKKTAKVAKETGAIVVGPPSIAYPLLVDNMLPSKQLKIIHHVHPTRTEKIKLTNVHIESFPSIHFFDDCVWSVHNSYLITIGGKLIFINGDTYEVPKEIKEKELDAMVCNFVSLEKDVSELDRFESLIREFRPKLMLPCHLINCNWTIEPEIVEKECRKFKSIKVLKKAGEKIDI